MLEMDQYEHIRIMERHHHKSIRQISRETGHHRRTVRKALAGLPPGYRRKVVLKRSVMGQYERIITDWLTADRAVHRKQRHTAKRIFDRLVAEYGFQGAASSVRKPVREVKQEMGLLAGEAMVPLEATMGEAEMDWGDLIVILKGKKTKAKMFCMRSRYSGKPFVRLYLNERQQMLFDGHIHAFAYYGGVFPTIVYDNLTTAVKQVLRGGRRVEQRDFQHFRSYYSFQSKFCNVARGNEKGGVEGLVKFSRQNFLVPIPEVESLEELNQKLLEQCDLYTERVLGGRETRQTVAAMAEEERKVLMTLLPPYETAVYRSAKVDKYQMIQVEGNRYSVPSRVGKTVQVSLGCQKVMISRDGVVIAEHEREFGKGRWVMDPLHYLKLLERKPGAFENARPIREWRKSWPVIYEKLLEKLRQRLGEGEGTRSFLRVLELHKIYEVEDIEAAVELGWERGVFHADGLKIILQNILEKEEELPAALKKERLPRKARVVVPEPDLSKYDLLSGGTS